MEGPEVIKKKRGRPKGSVNHGRLVAAVCALEAQLNARPVMSADLPILMRDEPPALEAVQQRRIGLREAVHQELSKEAPSLRAVGILLARDAQMALDEAGLTGNTRHARMTTLIHVQTLHMLEAAGLRHEQDSEDERGKWRALLMVAKEAPIIDAEVEAVS